MGMSSETTKTTSPPSVYVSLLVDDGDIMVIRGVDQQSSPGIKCSAEAAHNPFAPHSLVSELLGDWTAFYFSAATMPLPSSKFL